MDEEEERYNTGVTERNKPYMNFLNENDRTANACETNVGKSHVSIKETHSISNSNRNSVPRIVLEFERVQTISNNNSFSTSEEEEEEDYYSQYDIYEQQRIPEVEEKFSDYLKM